VRKGSRSVISSTPLLSSTTTRSCRQSACPKADGRDEDEAEVAVGGLVVAGSQSAAMFELGEASLDEVSEGVHMTVHDRLDLAVSLARDDDGDVAGFQVAPDEVGVVALVGQKHARLGSGSAITGA